MGKLADKDFQVKESGDSIMYVLGGYDEKELSDKIKELEENNVEVQGVVEIAENEDVKTLENDQIEKIINSPEIISEDSSEIISEGSSDSELDTKEDMVQ